jgi:hypothetical protein
MTGNPINYWAGFVVDIAGVALFLTLGLRAGGANSLARFTSVALGYCGWTLFEYNVHRFLFHGEWSPLAPGHLAHHAAPRRTIGLPFFVAFGIAATLFAVCWLAMPIPYPYFFVVGAYLGWLSYGILHHVEHVADLSAAVSELAPASPRSPPGDVDELRCLDDVMGSAVRHPPRAARSVVREATGMVSERRADLNARPGPSRPSGTTWRCRSSNSTRTRPGKCAFRRARPRVAAVPPQEGEKRPS